MITAFLYIQKQMKGTMNRKQRYQLTKERRTTMTNEAKCKAGVYDSVNVVIIRLKKILSDYKISKKVRNSLEDIRDNNWQGKNDK